MKIETEIKINSLEHKLVLPKHRFVWSNNLINFGYVIDKRNATSDVHNGESADAWTTVDTGGSDRRFQVSNELCLNKKPCLSPVTKAL